MGPFPIDVHQVYYRDDDDVSHVDRDIASESNSTWCKYRTEESDDLFLLAIQLHAEYKGTRRLKSLYRVRIMT